MVNSSPSATGINVLTMRSPSWEEYQQQLGMHEWLARQAISYTPLPNKTPVVPFPEAFP
jgi:hypothetical protein